MHNIKRTVASAVVSASMTINLLPAIGLANEVGDNTDLPPATEKGTIEEQNDEQGNQGSPSVDPGSSDMNNEEAPSADNPVNENTNSDSKSLDNLEGLDSSDNLENNGASQVSGGESGKIDSGTNNEANDKSENDILSASEHPSEDGSSDSGETVYKARSGSGTDTSIDEYDLGCGAYKPNVFGPGIIINGYTEILYNVASSLPEGDRYLNPCYFRLAGWQDVEGNDLGDTLTGPGSYRMVLEGCEPYHGTLVTEPVEMRDATNIEDESVWTVSYVTPSLTNGVLSDPGFAIAHTTLNGDQICLVPGEDFAVTWTNSESTELEGDPTVPGVYTALLTAQGSFSGTRSITLALNDQYDLSSPMYDYQVSASYGYVVGDTVLTASEIYLAGLTLGTDFEVTWFDAENNQLSEPPQTVGTFTAVLTGIGLYHGSRPIEVEMLDGYYINVPMYILRPSEGRLNVDGTVIEPTVSICLSSDFSTPVLAEGTDYLITWFDADGKELDHIPNEAGTYTAQLEGIAPYYGTRTSAIKVVDFGDVSVIVAPTIRERSYFADGEFTMGKLEPRYPGALDDFTTDDYTTTWFDTQGNELEGNPTTAGSFDVRIDGVGRYHGSVTIRTSVYDARDISTYSWWFETEDGLRDMAGSIPLVKDGVLITPLRDSSFAVPDDCFTITWTDEEGNELPGDPTTPGGYSYRIDGINGYHGSYTGMAIISDYYDISRCDVLLDAYADQDGVHISRCDLALWTYSNFTSHYIYRPADSIAIVSWSNTAGNLVDPSEIVPGFYYVTVEGRGSFYGTKTISMQVLDSNDIASFSYEIDEPGCINSDGSFTNPSVTLYRLIDGERVVLDPAYYEIQGWSGLPSGKLPSSGGTYNLILVGNNGYAGSMTIAVKVVEEVEPTEPMDPVEPVKPGNPEDPTEPPAEPGNPEQGEPDKPAEPGNPDKPIDSEEPGDPDPVDPTEPPEASNPEPGSDDSEGEGATEGESTADKNPDAEDETPEQPQQSGQSERQPASLTRTADDNASPVATALVGALAVLTGAFALVRRAFGSRSDR